MNYNVGDSIYPYGKIIKITKCFTFFENNVKIHHSKLKNKDIKYKYSPNIEVDWTNFLSVDNYYSLFEEWIFPIRNGDCKKCEIFEVKNNKIFIEGEYYLPHYYERKIFLEDGFIFGFCLKLTNNFYSHLGGNKVNVFYIQQFLYEKDILEETNKKNLLNNSNKLIYLKNINVNKINLKDLNLYKDNILNLLKDYLPYNKEGVSFYKDSIDKIGVSYRNRIGALYVDNSYHGHMPYDNNYGLIIKIKSYHFNECRYLINIYNNEITFDNKMFNILIEKIKETWDKAIENNAILYGG